VKWQRPKGGDGGIGDVHVSLSHFLLFLFDFYKKGIFHFRNNESIFCGKQIFFQIKTIFEEFSFGMKVRQVFQIFVN